MDKLAAYLTLHAMDLDGVEIVELRSSVWYSHLMSEWPFFVVLSSHITQRLADEVSDLLQKAAGDD